jgi:hypothetical protein
MRVTLDAEGVSWMNVAIVYESLFGNTRAVAEAIADGVRQADPFAHVDLLPVAGAKDEQVGNAGLLIVGGPTHMRGMTSDMTRRKGLEAEEKAAKGKGRTFVPEAGAEGPGIRDWFGALPKPRPARMRLPLTPGWTANWPAVQRGRSPSSSAGTAMAWSRSRPGSSSTAPRARCATASGAGRRPGEWR